MRTYLSLFLILAACRVDAPSADLFADPGLGDSVAAGKEDGIFGSREITLGQTVNGETRGGALALFTLELDERDQFTVDVQRTSGDLRPSAYLYDGNAPHDFVRPESYDAGSEAVSLDFLVGREGVYYIAVQAYRGEGNGEFELTTTCTGGPCAGGSSLTGLPRADQCITRATDCALTRLPDYNGSVGAARAGSLLNECLLAEGDDCVAACDESEGSRAACDVVLDELPVFADQSHRCLIAFSGCLDACQEAGPFGYGDSDDALTSRACWAGYGGSDFYGNCLEFAADHVACGGTGYAAGTSDECNARCAASDGAWGEGPWDSCTDECTDVNASCAAIEETVADCVFDGDTLETCSGHVGRESVARECCDGASFDWCGAVEVAWDSYISDVADEAGEYVTVDDSFSFSQIDWSEVPQAHKDTIGFVIADFNEESNRLGRTDVAERSEENFLSISNEDGDVIGYMISIDYFIDDPLYDGGGAHVYMNLSGSIVERVEWTG